MKQNENELAYRTSVRAESVGALVFISIMLVAIAFAWSIDIKYVHMYVGVIIGFLAHFAIININRYLLLRSMRRAGVTAVTSFALLCTPSADAQEQLPGYAYDYEGSVSVSLPNPDGHVEKIGIIPVAACVAVVVIGGGYIAVKIISYCKRQVKKRDAAVSNALDEAQSPLLVPPSQIPVVTGPPPNTSACQECSGDVAPDGVPLPLLVQQSTDGETWSTVASGTSVGSTHVVEPGFIRLVAMPLRVSMIDGQVSVHAPPGVLEFCTDLKDWQPIATNYSETDFIAEPGFYRVRL